MQGVLPRLAVLLGISFLLGFSFVGMLTPDKLNALFNSDLVHPQSLLDDVFVHGGALRDWTLPPNPSLFPDGLFYLLAWLVSADIRSALLVYAVIAFFFLTLSAALLVRARAAAGADTGKTLGGSEWWLAILLGLPVLWDASPLNHSNGLFLSIIVLPISHGTIPLIALWCWYLASYFVGSHEAKVPSSQSSAISIGWHGRALFLLLALSAASDRLVQVAVGAPLLVIVALQAYRRREAVRCSFLWISLILGALISGELLLRGISLVVPLGEVPPPLGAQVGERMLIAAHALHGDLVRHPAIFVLAVVLLAWALRALWYWREAPPFETFLALSFMAALVAPVITGVYRPGALRYLTPSMLLLVVGLSVQWGHHLRAYVPLILWGWIAMLVVGLGQGSLGAYFWYRPPLVRCLDMRVGQLPGRVGVADFWNAGRVNHLSTRGITLVPVDGRARLFDFALNRRKSKERLEQASFIVMDRLNPRSIKRRFGAPARIESCGGAVVWVLEPRKSP